MQRLEVEQVRTVIRLNRVYRVVDRALDHRHAARLPVGRRSDRDGLSLRIRFQSPITSARATAGAERRSRRPRTRTARAFRNQIHEPPWDGCRPTIAHGIGLSPCDVRRIFCYEMQRLDAGDLERVGRFVAEAGAIQGDEPFPPAFLAALQRLIPCDSVTFCELDRIGRARAPRHDDPRRAGLGGGSHLDYWQARRRAPDLPLPRDHGRLARIPPLRLRRDAPVPAPAGSTPSGFDPTGSGA